MKVWIVTPYEPLPLLSPNVRPFRCGMLSEALLDCGHEVVFLTSKFDHFARKNISDGLESNFEKKTIKKLKMVYLEGYGYGRKSYLRRVLHNRKLADSFAVVSNKLFEKPDVIYVQIPTLELADSVVKFANHLNIPVVVDIRDLWPDAYTKILPSFLRSLAPLVFFLEYRRVARILLNCNSITAVSNTYLNWALEHAGKEVSAYDRVFYLGFPSRMRDNVGKADARKYYGIPADALLVTFAGSFCSSFNLKTVLKAARQLNAQFPEKVFFVLAGDGEEFGLFRQQLNGDSNVVLPGRLNSVDLAALLKASDLGLAPYASNALMSLPNKPFEYMSAGLPTVYSLKGELKDLLEELEVGVYYDADAPSSLVSAIRDLLNSRDKISYMSKSAKSVYESKLNDRVIYNDFVKHLEFMAQSVRTGHR